MTCTGPFDAVIGFSQVRKTLGDELRSFAFTDGDFGL